MKTKWVSRVLCGLLCAGLLCGFAAPPAEENADLVPRQFQTAQQIDRISVEDAISNVTIRTADTDHITVDYADTTEKPLYTISVEDGLLSIHTTTEEFEGKSISLIQMGGKNVSEHPSHDLVITLPQKQYQELSVALAVGILSVEGVKASQLTAEAAVNAVELSGIQADQLNAASAVGKMVLRDSQIGSAEIDGAVGDVTVKNVTASGRMTVSNAVGSVSLEDVTAHELIVQSALGHTSYKNVESAYSKEEGIFNWSSGTVSQP